MKRLTRCEMSDFKIILIFMSILLVACNGQKKAELQAEKEPEFDQQVKTVINDNLDLSHSARLFAQQILKGNLREHLFDLTSNRNLDFIKIFNSDSLESIIAFFDKNYPKKTPPRYAEQYTLFVATYGDTLSAAKCFEQLKEDSKYELREGVLFEDLPLRVRLLFLETKSGGMIVQQGLQVFFLVENCRETPIGGKWIDYESVFLEFLTSHEEEIEVLNADCGMDQYQIEKRITRR
jgi:hypothetical protein